MPNHVFVSHSSQDKAVADRVCQALESAGIGCWIAPRDILPGADWAEGIMDAIEHSALFVLIVSSHSNDSPQVLREVERTVSKRITILPVRIEDVVLTKALEYFVSSHHWLDALDEPLEPHLDKLVRTVKKFYESKGITPPEPGEVEAAPAPSSGSGAAPKPKGSKKPVRAAALVVAVLALAAAIWFLTRPDVTPAPDGTQETPLNVDRSAVWVELETLAENAGGVVDVTTNQETYALGDTMVISCRVTEDGYVNVFNVSPEDDSVTVLFPNRYHPDNHVRAGAELTIPSPDDTFELRASPPLGESLVVVVHTSRELNAFRDEEYRSATELFNSLPTARTRSFSVEARSDATYSAGKAVVLITEE